MNRLRRFFALPLLVKELTESSARWRTYGARVLFAAGLYGLVALFLPRSFWAPDSTTTYNAFYFLGMGRNLFEGLIVVEAAGIALFLPAMMCGCITQEKERDSLVLLLLTELRPWQVLLQKYLGSLVPVLSFVLLSGPLMAVAYSLGGVEDGKLLEQALGVVLLVFQLGALTLLCSVWCRTTVAALLSSYVLGALLYVAPPLLAHSLFPRFSSMRDELMLLLIPPAAFEISSSYSLGTRALYLLPSVLSLLLFLGLARFFFLRRAFAPPGTSVRRAFRWLDAFMQRANRFTGGVVLLGERHRLPGDAPIFWRETRTRALGRPHYLVRVLLVAEVLAVPPCLFFSLPSNDGYEGLIAVLGGLALLVVAVQSANVIVSERVNQTLEVLLTTPLEGGQIIREKERALFRLLLVIALPLLTVIGLHYYIRYDFPDEPLSRASSSVRIIGTNFEFGTGLSNSDRASFVCSVLAVFVFLPLVAWLAMSIGLWMRTRFRAIIVTLILLVTWCVLPLVISDTMTDSRAKDVCALFSPLGLVITSYQTGVPYGWYGGLPYSRYRGLRENIPWQIVAGNFGSYGALALGLRALLLGCGNRWLRRL